MKSHDGENFGRIYHSFESDNKWIHLEASSESIRKRMHSETKTSEEYIREILKIPENVNVLSIIALGYPDEEKKPKSEKKLLYERVFYNSFGKNRK